MEAYYLVRCRPQSVVHFDRGPLVDPVHLRHATHHEASPLASIPRREMDYGGATYLGGCHFQFAETNELDHFCRQATSVLASSRRWSSSGPPGSLCRCAWNQHFWSAFLLKASARPDFRARENSGSAVLLHVFRKSQASAVLLYRLTRQFIVTFRTSLRITFLVRRKPLNTC